MELFILPSSSGIDVNKVDAQKLDHLVARLKREDLHREDNLCTDIKILQMWSAI